MILPNITSTGLIGIDSRLSMVPRSTSRVTESAVKLAGARQGHIRQYDGEFLRLVASYGESPEELAVLPVPQKTKVNVPWGPLMKRMAPVTIIAHSLGAGVVLNYCGAFPETVKKVVAIEPPV